LHGGTPQIDNTLTRWSQVTHYYFENCIFYTPAFSNEALGQLDLRTITNIATGGIEPNLMLGEEITVAGPSLPLPTRKGGIWTAKRGSAQPATSDLSADFDAAPYYRLHPDVAAAGQNAESHYLLHGWEEGRRYWLP
jgi:hypothetical protein